MAKTKKHHSVYVIELDEAVLREKRFVLANPERDPYLSCLYVGMTGLDPRCVLRIISGATRPIGTLVSTVCICSRKSMSTIIR